MSIEAKNANHSAKAVAGMEQRSGKKPTAGDASAAVAGGGFSALMNLMADAIPEEDLKLTDFLFAGTSQSSEGSEALAHMQKALDAIDNEANVVLLTPVGVDPAGLTSTSLASDGLPGSAAQAAIAVTAAPMAAIALAARSGVQATQGISDSALAVQGHDPSHGVGMATAAIHSNSTPKVATVSTTATAATTATTATTATAAKVATAAAPATMSAQRPLQPVFQATDVLQLPTENAEQIEAKGLDVLTSHKRQLPPQSFAFGNSLNESRDLKAIPTTVQLAVAQDAAQMVSMMTDAQGFMRPQDRSGRPLSAQSGSGLEGAFGSALMDKLGINATYEVAPTVAVVADTQVAETVSYWVTHGVQSAELTLDGFGNEPVEVRISLNGDQAQIDFWSNQADVRQVLEDASAQLKEMLSSEGLQLTGMSVGTSGRERGQSEGDQPKLSMIRQSKLSSVEPLVATTSRSANRAVGQSLDLYV